MNNMSLFLRLVILSGLIGITYAQRRNISDYLPGYIKAHNAAVGNDPMEKVQLVKVDKKYNWAKLNCGSLEGHNYLFKWHIGKKDYLVEVICYCHTLCEPSDFAFYLAPRYDKQVASPINFSIAKKYAKEKLGEDNYKLYFLPSLKGPYIYVFARYEEELPTLGDEENASQEAKDLFSNCVYTKKEFSPINSSQITYIGIYSIRGGKVYFRRAD